MAFQKAKALQTANKLNTLQIAMSHPIPYLAYASISLASVYFAKSKGSNLRCKTV